MDAYGLLIVLGRPAPSCRRVGAVVAAAHLRICSFLQPATRFAAGCFLGWGGDAV